MCVSLSVIGENKYVCIPVIERIKTRRKGIIKQYTDSDSKLIDKEVSAFISVSLEHLNIARDL